MAPSSSNDDLKVLFRRLAEAGAGRPTDKDGFPLGSWTPELLAEAITQIDTNGSGVDLRTTQLWFQDNDKGVSTENIRRLARLFGCNDPKATSEWQAELSASRRRLAAKRKKRRETRRPDLARSPDLALVVSRAPLKGTARDAVDVQLKRRFSLARKSEMLFSNTSTLNLPAVVWAGCVTLGFLAYILGVHSITYSPIEGVNKQVGYFWAPNWTLLEMVILPLFLVTVVDVLAFWKQERRSLVPLNDEYGWERRVESFSLSHWAAFFICFFIVFLLQWSGVHLRALVSGDAGNLMMDWNLIAIVRPDTISIVAGTFLSMLAFLYTALICFLFLTGLILLYTVIQDFSEICKRSNIPGGNVDQQKIAAIGSRLIQGIFRGAVLGIWIATCIKLQAVYLLSDGTNILHWLVRDASFAMGIVDEANGWLDQRSLAHFTSFLLLFSTCSVFLFAAIHIHPSVKQSLPSGPSQHLTEFGGVPVPTTLSIVFLLVVNFLLLGRFPGFSVLLLLSIIATIWGLFASSFERSNAGPTTPNTK